VRDAPASGRVPGSKGWFGSCQIGRGRCGVDCGGVSRHLSARCGEHGVLVEQWTRGSPAEDDELALAGTRSVHREPSYGSASEVCNNATGGLLRDGTSSEMGLKGRVGNQPGHLRLEGICYSNLNRFSGQIRSSFVAVDPLSSTWELRKHYLEGPWSGVPVDSLT